MNPITCRFLNSRRSRLLAVNEMILTISTCGRRFFNHRITPGGNISKMEFGKQGRLYFIDGYTGKHIYLHYKYWEFHHGGTMRTMINGFRDFVMDGKLLHPLTFGPWPTEYCGGDLWGYGEDMKIVREKAHNLGIVEKK